MKKNKHFKQGLYNPLHPEKYRGSLPICYRSGMELKMFRYLDQNENILSWGSETIIIPYFDPVSNKVRRYFVDNNFIIKDREGNIRKLLVEIKPFQQTLPPKKSPRKKPATLLHEQATYVRNQSKWKYASEWAKKNGYEFYVFTEKELGL